MPNGVNRSPHGETSAGRPAVGLFAGANRLAVTLLAAGRTRLELLGNEFEEEKQRALRLLLLAQGMVFCFGVATLLGVALLALVFRENPLTVIGAMALLFAMLGGIFYRSFMHATQRKEAAFASSLAELEEDIRQLKAAAQASADTAPE